MSALNGTIYKLKREFYHKSCDEIFVKLDLKKLYAYKNVCRGLLRTMRCERVIRF